MIKPNKWYDVYPYGTKEGDDESKVFRALSRSKFDYRSTSGLVKATGLTRDRVEEIIDKYISCDPPLIVPHKKNEEHWGYWERCQDRLQENSENISDKEKYHRIEKYISGANMVNNSKSVYSIDF